MNQLYFKYRALRKKVCTALSWRINRILFKWNGISFGKNLMVNGNPILEISPKASVSIGSDCFFTSGRVNPLCQNRRLTICCRPGTRLTIGHNCGFSSVIFDVRKAITIGNHVNGGGNVVFMDSDAHSLNYLDRRDGNIDEQNKVDQEIVIGDDVLIGLNSVILKGVHIGSRVVIGANSVVTKDIPDDCIAAGNPAKVIRRTIKE